MRSAQSVVQFLIEATKSRSIAFGPLLPGEGYRALGKEDMFQRLKGYRISPEDALQRFAILYTDNDADLRVIGDTNVKLSQENWNSTVHWLRLDPDTVLNAVVDLGNGQAGRVIPVTKLFNFQDRNDRSSGANRSVPREPDELDPPYFGLTYDEEEKPPTLTAVQGTAKRAGLRPNDQILKMGGNDISEPGELKKALGAAKHGEPVVFVVRRAQMYCPKCYDEQSVIANRTTECTRCGHLFKAAPNVSPAHYKVTLVPT